MPERDLRLYINDILDSLNKIMLYTQNVLYDSFLGNDMLKDAVIRNIEIIGEAVKKLPKDFTDKYHHIEWRKIAGLRDIVIHHYFGINEGIIWDVIKNKVPDMLQEIKKIIEDLENS